MKLKKLFKDIPHVSFHGKDTTITGVCANSKVLAPGNLFVARRGKSFDGTQFIPEAITCGAVALLTDIYDPTLGHISQVIHPDPAAIEAEIATRFYNNPSHELFSVGITGTNGKTTTSFLVRHLLKELGLSTGLIGSIEYCVGDHSYQPSHTTPDVLTCHKLLREMRVRHCQALVMEVTSHALDQGRVEGIDFDIATFTNLSQDHLDYHKDMESYAAAKSKLFTELGEGKLAILNADDPYSLQVFAESKAKALTYGFSAQADLRAEQLELSEQGCRCQISYAGESALLELPMSGRFNVSNALAAIAVGLSRGAPLSTLCEALKNFPGVPGRLERVKACDSIPVFVDFSHTPDALEKALETLKEICKGRLIVVFGCGGDRDKGKRPLMAQAAEKWADISIVTSDNPRTESPEAIIKDVLSGFSQREQVFVHSDRRDAIAQALKEARPGDMVLIAGKGHESYQIFAHKTIDFDDRLVAEACYQELHSLTTS